jgi:predicted LPLAT superfamily acyltransferase
MGDFQRTFGIIKPDAVANKVAGPIIARIEESGLSIVAMKRMQLDEQTAKGFYAVHKERPFFGELAHTSTVPARLSLRTGAPLLPFFLIRDRSGYHFEWEPPIRQVEEEADESQMIQQLTVEMTAAIERAIRRHPSQWPWMHQRWHSTPEIVLRRQNRRAHRSVEAEVQEA